MAESDYETALRADDRLDLRMWLRLLTCATMIEGRVRRRLRDSFDTTLPRFDVLAQLDRAPDGLTMGELSGRLMVSNGNVTALVERLVREGLVDSRPRPDDRRVQRVRLTESGRRQFARMAPANRAWIAAMTAGLSRDDMARLYELLGRLKGSVSAADRRVEEGADGAV
ncbi:MAG: MarR family transcriptional regulator [Rhodospirillales bacterium]|nr:MarR family transcriptional regulator [Rhodospirillales bacterium]